ncbi:hypothetical protein ACHAW6_009535 [Cyclotella cf. meneghiniana]
MRRHCSTTTTSAAWWNSRHPCGHRHRHGIIQSNARVGCCLSGMTAPLTLNVRSIHRTLQRATADYFRTLGIDQSFTISSSSLKSKYRHLMKDLHPDRHADLSQEDKSQKSLEATNVTRAYSVINNPLSRALHLLDLWGASIDESNNSIIDPKCLLRVMEMREAVEQASTDEQLKPLLQSCQSKQKEVIDALTIAFREKKVEDAKYLTASLQYWSKIEERIRDKISSI